MTIGRITSNAELGDQSLELAPSPALARQKYLDALSETQRQAERQLLPRGGRLLKTVTSDVPEELVRKILSSSLGSPRAGLHDS